MDLAIFSFLAGFLTLLAPCILPVLPIILGRATTNIDSSNRSLRRPFIIIASLLISIALFTLLLKATTLFISVPTIIWSLLSGIIIFLFGLSMIFPLLWEKIMMATGLSLVSNKAMNRASTGTTVGDIVLGASLGPVFNSCSPTYALIVAAILPASFINGMIYLTLYCLGLGVGLLLIALFGRAITTKLQWMTNPHGYFRKVIGTVFIVIGVAIVFGLDKKAQAYILEAGFYKPIESIENTLLN